MTAACRPHSLLRWPPPPLFGYQLGQSCPIRPLRRAFLNPNEAKGNVRSAARDKYGRRLVYVHRVDGTEFNAEIIKREICGG